MKKIKCFIKKISVCYKSVFRVLGGKIGYKLLQKIQCIHDTLLCITMLRRILRYLSCGTFLDVH